MAEYLPSMLRVLVLYTLEAEGHTCDARTQEVDAKDQKFKAILSHTSSFRAPLAT